MDQNGERTVFYLAEAAASRDGLAVVVVSALLVSMIYLQKLGITINEGSFGLNVALLWIGLALVALVNQLAIDVSRLLAFTALLASMSLSMALSPEESRWSAFVIFIAMFAGFIFRIPVSPILALRSLLFFQRLMVPIAGIVILQQLLQLVIGPHIRISIEDVIPDYLLYPGFAYIRPVAWNSPYTVPNGLFLLEPSTVSGYLAAALVAELVWFKSGWRIVVFITALVAGMALTGFIAILVTLPFWFWRAEPRIILALALLIAPLAGAALSMGWLDPLIDRADELSSDASSAYARLVVPMQSIASQIGDPAHWFTGLGAGSSPKGADRVQWPFSKLLHEYGLASAVLFHVFLVQAVVSANYLRSVTVVLLLPYLCFGGGFVAHASVMPLLLLGPIFLMHGQSDADSIVDCESEELRAIRK